MENSLASVTLVTLEQKKNIQQKGDAYNEKRMISAMLVFTVILMMQGNVSVGA